MRVSIRFLNSSFHHAEDYKPRCFITGIYNTYTLFLVFLFKFKRTNMRWCIIQFITRYPQPTAINLKRKVPVQFFRFHEYSKKQPSCVGWLESSFATCRYDNTLTIWLNIPSYWAILPTDQTSYIVFCKNGLALTYI